MLVNGIGNNDYVDNNDNDKNEDNKYYINNYNDSVNNKRDSPKLYHFEDLQSLIDYKWLDSFCLCRKQVLTEYIKVFRKKLFHLFFLLLVSLCILFNYFL